MLSLPIISSIHREILEGATAQAEPLDDQRLGHAFRGLFCILCYPPALLAMSGTSPRAVNMSGRYEDMMVWSIWRL